MAIQLYCGLPGSGKSYGVVENVVIPAVQQGRPVCTNLPLRVNELETAYPICRGLVKVFDNREVNGEMLMSCPGGAVIILDEAWRFWPSGLKANKMDQAEKEFFAEHRHKTDPETNLTQEICLITQSPSQLAKVVRDLVDQTVITRKNSAVGSDKTFNVDIYPGCAASLDRPGQSITSGFGRYKPEIYRFYRSHTKSATGLPGVELRADNRGRAWNHPFIRYVLPVVLLAGFWGLYKIKGIYDGQKSKETIQEVTATPAKVLPAPSVPPIQVYEEKPKPESVPVAPKPESERWRVAGVKIAEGVVTVYLADNRGRMRKIAAKECSFDIDGATCEIGGEIVNRYTGNRSMSTVLSDTASVALTGGREP